jgi:uncharacterized membrane protein HdeD (DUF308 family)
LIKKELNNVEKKNMLLSILLIALGVLLVVKPDNVVNFIVIAIGAFLMVTAIIDLVFYFMNAKLGGNFINLSKGIIEFIGSIFLMFRSEAVVSLFPVVIGLIIIFSSIFKLYVSLSIKSIDSKKWIPNFVLSILCILFGVVIVLNPFETVTSIVRLAGIVLIVSEVFNLIYSGVLVFSLKKMDEAVTDLAKKDDGVKEAKIIEEKPKKKE